MVVRKRPPPRKKKPKWIDRRVRNRSTIVQDAGVKAAIKAAGNPFRLARDLGLTPAAIYRWERVPCGRIIAVENATGVARKRLRPDLYC